MVKFSWSYPSRQRIFKAVALDPKLLPLWCKNIPDSATEPSSFVRTLSLERLTADHLIEHIKHLKAFSHVTSLSLGEFAGETFDREKIERCFNHFGPTAQCLSLLIPRCKASLFPRPLNLFTQAVRIDINIPYITQDVDKVGYQPLPNLDNLGLGLGYNATIDYDLLEACTNLRRVYISCPRSSSKFWFNHLFIRCAGTLEFILIGPERQGQPNPPHTHTHTHVKGLLIDLLCGPRSDCNCIPDRDSGRRSVVEPRC